MRLVFLASLAVVSSAFVAACHVPGVAPQQPSPRQEPKLDERLPPPRSHGARSFRARWQPLRATLAAGTGGVLVRARGSGLDDRADASFWRLGIERETGPALHVDWFGSDRALFGVEPPAADLARARLQGMDVFPHVRIDAAEAIGLRAGVFTDWQQLDQRALGYERRWLGFGPRLLAEPVLQLSRGGDRDWQLFARGGGDIGFAWFSESGPGGGQRDVAERYSFELGGGVRVAAGAMNAELGYRLQHLVVGSIDAPSLGDPGRTELQRQQLYLSFGVTF